MPDVPTILPFPSPRRRAGCAVVVRWLTLLSFTAASIGVPLEPLWGTTPSCAKRPGEACRCSAVSRSLGRCCCSRGTKASVPAASASSCQSELKQTTACQTKTGATRSCCAKKSAAKPATATQTTDQPSSLAIQACPCDASTPSTALLLCGEPHVLPTEIACRFDVTKCAGVVRFDQHERGQRRRPAVPPPRVLSV